GRLRLALDPRRRRRLRAGPRVVRQRVGLLPARGRPGRDPLPPRRAVVAARGGPYRVPPSITVLANGPLYQRGGSLHYGDSFRPGRAAPVRRCERPRSPHGELRPLLSWRLRPRLSWLASS